MNERSHLAAPCLCLSRHPILSLALPITPCAISGPLREINWPPTKEGKSGIPPGEKGAIAIIVTECVEDPFKYVIPNHGLHPRAPLTHIFINNYRLIEENIWLLYVGVILLGKCDELLVFYENIINPRVINLVQKLTALLSNRANN